VSAPFNDATTALLRAVQTMLETAATFVVEEVRSRSWASVTFTGARHQLTFRLEGDGAEAAAARFASGLEAAEFSLRGHVLADIVLLTEERRPGWARLGIEALTVEDS
jgi:hypothetical protein